MSALPEFPLYSGFVSFSSLSCHFDNHLDGNFKSENCSVLEGNYKRENNGVFFQM